MNLGGEGRRAYHLISEHQNGLERKLSLAVVEKVLETGYQQVDDHDIVVSFDSEPVNIWNSN